MILDWEIVKHKIKLQYLIIKWKLMKEYIIDNYSEKFIVTLNEKSAAEFNILCDTRSIAHHLALSLNLGTMETPLENPGLFTFIGMVRGLKTYSLSLVSPNLRVDEDADINDCCQSGCSGCPFFNG